MRPALVAGSVIVAQYLPPKERVSLKTSTKRWLVKALVPTALAAIVNGGCTERLVSDSGDARTSLLVDGSTDASRSQVDGAQDYSCPSDYGSSLPKVPCFSCAPLSPGNGAPGCGAPPSEGWDGGQFPTDRRYPLGCNVVLPVESFFNSPLGCNCTDQFSDTGSWVCPD